MSFCLNEVLKAADDLSHVNVENTGTLLEVIYTECDIGLDVGTQEPDVKTDPLQDDNRNKPSGFPWEFDDEDFLQLQDRKENQSADQHTATRAKRSRPSNSNEVKARSGVIWYKTPENDATNACTNATIESFQPKGKGPANSVANALDAWYLLIDEPILIRIVKYTNDEIRTRKRRPPDERQTDLVEMRAWIGLNYLCGLFRNAEHCGPLEELWTTELGNTIFRATMELKRFQFLAESLRFNETTSAYTKPATSIDAACLIWEKFIINCRSYYAPSGHCSINEHIVCGINNNDGFPFDLSLPQAKDKKGMRLVCLHDAKTLYMHNAIVTKTDIPSEREVLTLVSDIKNTRRHVALSERYTSIKLAENLQQRQLTVTGVMSSTDEDLPAVMVTDRNVQRLYGAATTLLSGYNANGEHEVILSSRLAPHLNALKMHATTRNCGERFQQLASVYSSSFSTPLQQKRWILHFFHTILDYAALNAWILLRLASNGDTTMTQRNCQRQLGLYLTQQHLKRRLYSKLPLLQRIEISEMLGEPTDKLLAEAATAATQEASHGTIPASKLKVPENITIMPKLNLTRKRCRKCKNKTRLRCQQCLMALCNHHMVSRCLDCSGVTKLPD